MQQFRDVNDQEGEDIIMEGEEAEDGRMVTGDSWVQR